MTSRPRSNRNRKRRAQARILPVAFVPLVVLCASILLVYLWVDAARAQLGQQIRKLETRSDELDNECRREENRWSALKSPENIEQALLRHGLNMSLPRGEQVVRLSLERPVGDYKPRSQLATAQ